MEKIKNNLQDLPKSPGVYLYKDDKGRVIYVGKAKNLKNRVSSYFSGKKDIKTTILVKKIKDLEVIITNSEYEALILENNLIKSHKPKYNINLKDGKTYPVVKITNEDFPRVLKTRRIINDGAKYFGPFPNVGLLDGVLDLIQKEYPIRRCRRMPSNKIPCLYYHLKQCAAPCAGFITKEEYAKYIKEISLMLEGDLDKIEALLKTKMQEFAKNLSFEQAAKYRDFLKEVGSLFAKQGIDLAENQTKDYVAFSREESHISFSVFQIIDGKLRGRDIIQLESFSNDEDAFLQFMIQYYPNYHSPPSEIFVDMPKDLDMPEGLEMLNKYFKEKFGNKTNILIPFTKRDISVLNMARENSKYDLNKRLRRAGLSNSLEILKDALDLAVLPSHIEGFDISHIDGKHTVASMVYFKNGNPKNSEYRVFKIKSLKDKIDDYQAIKEVIARRYRRVLNEGLDFPKLIVIDGGLGQVNAAKSVLDNLGCKKYNLIGLAEKEELIVFPNGKTLKLNTGDEGLRILQHIRDEAHRFANRHSKKLHNKNLKFSMLEEIPGIGKVYSEKIMKNIKSIEDLYYISAQELSKLADIPLKSSKSVIEFFNKAD